MPLSIHFGVHPPAFATFRRELSHISPHLYTHKTRAFFTESHDRPPVFFGEFFNFLLTKKKSVL